MTSPTDFICGPSLVHAAGTSRSPAGDLDHDVVDRGLKRPALRGDVVPEFVQRIAHSTLAASLAIGKPVALQARAEDATREIHLDDHHRARLRGLPQTGCCSPRSRPPPRASPELVAQPLVVLVRHVCAGATVMLSPV